MTPDQFLALFPQFAAKSAAVPAALAEAALFVGEKWGKFAALGLGNYAAHKIVWGAVTSGEDIAAFDAGLITSKTVGRVSLGRATELAVMQFKNSFNYTKYGRRYLELRDTYAGIGAVTV
jgi:hypothetical protein